jgi:hypothetical protein
MSGNVGFEVHSPIAHRQGSKLDLRPMIDGIQPMPSLQATPAVNQQDLIRLDLSTSQDKAAPGAAFIDQITDQITEQRFAARTGKHAGNGVVFFADQYRARPRRLRTALVIVLGLMLLGVAAGLGWDLLVSDRVTGVVLAD